MREQKTKEYLTAIYLLSAFGPVRGAYVARELKLSRPTVSVSLQMLAEAGYLTMDNEHLIQLTEAGEKLAREAMHETVRRGKSYHELVGQPDEDEAEERCGQRRRLSRNQAQRWLEKERADEIPEAILILSRRYYCVRVIDIAQFLGKNSASVRAKLRQLENNNLVTIGVESVVRLTEFGREIAKALYDRHKTEREDLIRAGQSPDEAERSVLIPGARLP